MKITILLIAEVILLVASVFIFRSMWMILDSVPFMHEPVVLWASLILAFVVTIPALRYVIRHGGK